MVPFNGYMDSSTIKLRSTGNVGIGTTNPGWLTNTNTVANNYTLTSALKL